MEVGFCLRPDDRKSWGLKEELEQVLIGDNLVYFKGYTKGQRQTDAGWGVSSVVRDMGAFEWCLP